MFKRSLVSAVAVAALSGAVVVPAQAATVAISGETCTISFAPGETAAWTQRVEEIMKGFLELPAVKKKPETAETLKNLMQPEVFTLPGEGNAPLVISRTEAERKVKKSDADFGETMARVDEMTFGHRSNSAGGEDLTLREQIQSRDYIKTEFGGLRQEVTQPLRDCAEGKASEDTTGSSAKERPFFEEDGKLNDGGIALAVFGSLAGVAALLAVAAPFLSQLFPMLPMI